MTVETGVTVTAQVAQTVHNMATTVATTTPEVSLWGDIIKWFINIFT